ncbi:hypothetical protein FACS1894176_03540 [Bacteroidia bacterium]|nr:hypothetical protein FACS1894176_03540 [Bacteroidia bacterium]
MIRPDTFRDGKVEFVRSQGTGIYAPFAIARYTNSDNGGNYYVGWILGQGEVTITKVIDGVLYNDNAL